MQVPLREQADQFSTFQYWQMSNAMLTHDGVRHIQRLLLANRVKRPRHVFLDRRFHGDSTVLRINRSFRHLPDRPILATQEAAMRSNSPTSLDCKSMQVEGQPWSTKP